MLNKISDYWWYYLILKSHEKKLLRYQGFGERSILEFKRQNNLDWKTVKIILDNLIIFDGLQLRNRLRTFVSQHNHLFADTNTYFTHFGPAGKSGSVILNQFKHAVPDIAERIIGTEDLNQLPQDSNIIFLDDFIGTGTQALDYIFPLTYVLNSSVKPYLFTLCSTFQGIFKIQEARSKFTIFSSLILNTEDYFLLDNNCKKFNDIQKRKIETLNSKLLTTGEGLFNLNIPFAFYYSIPDNSLPLLWKDGVEYIDDDGKPKKWYALMPRDY